MQSGQKENPSTVAEGEGKEFFDLEN